MAAPAPKVGAGAKEYFPEPLMSRKKFEDWGQACRVRQIQDRYDEMLENASGEGLTLDQYMKKHNMKDKTEFLLTCPKFSLFCWPSALAELGSGVVLYFQFMVFLGSLLLLAFLVQLPAIMEYWDKDYLKIWVLKVKKNDTEVLGNMFMYTSPGMLGPEMSDSNTVPFCYFILVSILCGVVIAKSAWQIRVDNVVDQGTTHPNDFAIMVEGLPANANDEEAIENFFKANAIRGKDDTEIVKVVIGWAYKEYSVKLRELAQLKKELLTASDERGKELEERIKQINTDLSTCAPDQSARIMSSGVVIVVFRYQSDMRRCLDRWQSLWATLAYRDWGSCNGIFGGPELPRFPTATGIGVWKIKVRRAPNPGEVNWDDLGVEREDRWKRFALTNAAMFLIIGISFAICFVMVKIKDNTNNTWLGFLPALGVSASNALVSISSKYFGEKEYHNTITRQTASQAIKMTIGMIVNTGVVMLALNLRDYEWYTKTGLVSDMLLIIGGTSIFQPIGKCLDIPYMTMKKRVRMECTDEKLQTYRDRAAAYNTTVLTKANLEEFKEFRLEYNRLTAKYNAAFEPSEMDMKRRYAFAVKTFVCCICYCHLIPFITLLGALGLMVQYWVDKKMLLSWYKRPAAVQGMEQAAISLVFIKFTTLLMPLCMWFFISPSYKDKNVTLYWMAFSYVPAAAICILPLGTIRYICCAPCRGRNRRQVASDDKEDYYTAQYMWTKEQKYHKSQRLYKSLPESKNPEMLDPLKSRCTKADDVKASYGVEVAITTEPSIGALDKTPSAPQVDAEVKPTSYGVTPTLVDEPATGGTEAPAVFGVPGGGDTPAAAAAATPTIGVTPGTPGDGDAPAAAAAATPWRKDEVVAGAVAGVIAADGPIWEMEIQGGWQKFDDDCHDHIEAQWLKFKGGSKGHAQITVRTRDMALSVDFERMTQMRKGKGKGKVRKIRRRPEEP